MSVTSSAGAVGIAGAWATSETYSMRQSLRPSTAVSAAVEVLTAFTAPHCPAATWLTPVRPDPSPNVPVHNGASHPYDVRALVVGVGAGSGGREKHMPDNVATCERTQPAVLNPAAFPILGTVMPCLLSAAPQAIIIPLRSDGRASLSLA